MFIEELAEPFLNIPSQTITSLLERYPNIHYEDTSAEMVYLKEEQKKYINQQIIAFSRRLEEVYASVSVEKGRQEDELHDIYKKGAEMTTERREKYEAICQSFESIRWTGTL